MHDALFNIVNTSMKNLNQMTKNELVDLVRDKEVVIMLIIKEIPKK